MNEIDDATIRLAGKKDEKAFKRVYDYYTPFVWKVIYKTAGGDRDAAAEIVQETFIRIYKSLHSFSFSAGLSTWIYRIAFNTAQSFLGKRAREGAFVNIDDVAIGGKPGGGDFETRETVEALMKTLSPEDRFLLTSREVNGVPFEELALIMDTRSEALRTRVSRLKAQLRTTFAKLNKVG